MSSHSNTILISFPSAIVSPIRYFLSFMSNSDERNLFGFTLVGVVALVLAGGCGTKATKADAKTKNANPPVAAHAAQKTASEKESTPKSSEKNDNGKMPAEKTPKPSDESNSKDVGASHVENNEKFFGEFRAAFTQDGRFAATGGNNATVRLFDVEAGKLTRTFAGNSAPVSALTFSRDSSTIAVGNSIGQLAFWTSGVADGFDEMERPFLGQDERRKTGGHIGPVSSLAVHPKGREIASGGEDGTVRTWIIPAGSPETLWANSRSVSLIEAISNTDSFLVGKKDGSLELWDTLIPQTIVLVAPNEQAITAIATCSNAPFVAAGDVHGKIRVIDLKTRKTILDSEVHKGAITGVKFHPTLPQLLTIGADGKAQLLNVRANSKPVERIIGKCESRGRLLVASHRGLFVAIAGDKVIEVINLQNGAIVHSLPAEGVVTSLAWTDEDRILVAGDAVGRLTSWNLSDGQKLFESQSHEGAIHAVASHARQAEVVSGGADGKLRVWHRPGRFDILAETGANNATVIAVSPQEKWLAMGSKDGVVQVFDVEKQSLIREYLRSGHSVNSLAWSPEGDWLAAGGDDGTIRVWEVAKDVESPVTLWAGSSVTKTAFHSTGPTLLVATNTGEVRAWKWPLERGKILTGHTDSITSIISVRSGTQVVTAGGDRICRLFDVASGKEQQTYEGSQNEITCLTHAADDSWIAAGDLNGQILVWNTQDRSIAGSVQIADDAITAIDANPSGQRIASASTDGLVRIWQMPIHAPVEIRDLKQATTAMAVSPDGGRVAIGLDNFSISISDTHTGEQILVLTGHEREVSALAWSSDGSMLLSGSLDQTARLWSVKDGSTVTKWEGLQTPIQEVAILADDETLLACTAEASLIGYSRKTGQQRVLQPAQQGAGPIAISPSGKRFAWAAANGSVTLINCESGETIGATPPGDKVLSLAWSGDDNSWIVLNSKRQVKYWNTLDPDPSRGWTNAPIGLKKISVSADGGRVFGYASDGLLRLWDAQGRVLQVFPWDKKNPVQNLVLGDNGRIATVVGNNGRTVAFRSSLVQIIRANSGRTETVGFADDQVLISAGADLTIRAWNVQDGAQMTKFEGCPAKTLGMAVATKASQLVVLDGNNKLYAWNLKDGGQIELKSELQEGTYLRMALHPDGKLIALLDDHGQFNVIDLMNMREVGAFASPVRDASTLAFLETGEIISASNKQAFVAREEAPAFICAAHSGTIVGLKTVPQKTEFFTAGEDGQVNLWNTDGKLVRSLAPTKSRGKSFTASINGSEVAMLSTNGRINRWSYSGDVLGNVDASADFELIEYMSQEPNSFLLSSGKLFQLYQAKNGKLQTAISPSAQISASTVSPNHGAFYGMSDEGKLLRCNVGPLQTLPADQRELLSVTLSNNGEFVGSGGEDGSVFVWKMPNLAQVCRLKGHSKPVSDLEFSRDESFIVSASSDKTVRAWNIAKSKIQQTIAIQNIPQSISISLDDQRVAVVVDEKTIPVFDLNTGKTTERVTSEGTTIIQARYSPKGLITLGGDKRVSLWETAIGSMTFTPQKGALASVDVVNDGSFIVTAGPECGIKLLDYTGQTVAEFETSQIPFRSIAISPDGQWMAGATLTGSSANFVSIWNLADRKLSNKIHAIGQVRSLNFSSDSGSLFLQCGERKLCRFDRASGLLLEEIETIADVQTAPAIKHGGQFVTIESDNRARVYEPSLTSIEHRHTGAVTSLTYDKSGSLVISGGADGRIVGWNPISRTTAFEFDPGLGAVKDIQTTLDQKAMIAAFADNAVAVWPLTGKASEPSSLFKHELSVNGAQLSSDSSLLATGSGNEVHLWAVASERETAQFLGHERTVKRVAINREKKTLVSFSEDNIIRSWKLPEDALTSSTIRQVKESQRDFAVIQSQDAEIDSIQKKQKASPGLAKSEMIELEGQLKRLRSGDERTGDEKASSNELADLDLELLETEMRIRRASKGMSRDAARMQWRRLKRRKEIERRLEGASATDRHELSSESALLETTDPKMLKLEDDEPQLAAEIEEKPLRSIKTDIQFDFGSFVPIKLFVSPDLKIIVASRERGDGSENKDPVPGFVRIWDAETGVELRSWKLNEPRRMPSMAFALNQQFIYTFPDCSSYDVSSGVSQSFAKDSFGIINRSNTMIALGLTAATTTKEPVLRLIDPESGSFLSPLMDGTESRVTALCFGPSGKSLFVALRERARHRLFEVDLQTLTPATNVIEEARHIAPWQKANVLGIETIAISTDEKYAVGYGRYVENEYRLTCWTKIDGKWVVRKGLILQSQSPLLQDGGYPGMWMIDDTAVLVSEVTNGAFRWIDLQSGNRLSWKLGTVRSVTAHSADGAWLVAGFANGGVEVVNLRKKFATWKFRSYSSPIAGICVSSDGGHILTIGQDNYIRIWSNRAFNTPSENITKPSRGSRGPIPKVRLKG